MLNYNSKSNKIYGKEFVKFRNRTKNMSFENLKIIIVYVSIHFSFMGKGVHLYTRILYIQMYVSIYSFSKSLKYAHGTYTFFNPVPTSYYIVSIFSFYQILRPSVDFYKRDFETKGLKMFGDSFRNYLLMELKNKKGSYSFPPAFSLFIQ